MELSEALSILKARAIPEAVLQADNICVVKVTHTLQSCPLGASAVYTQLDATFDTPAALDSRLSENRSHLKRLG